MRYYNKEIYFNIKSFDITYQYNTIRNMLIFIISDSMNKKGKNTNTFITYLLITFIMICGIFRYKTIFIESNNVLEVSLSNLLYPFTFLFIILICKKWKREL